MHTVYHFVFILLLDDGKVFLLLNHVYLRIYLSVHLKSAQVRHSAYMTVAGELTFGQTWLQICAGP